MRRTTPVGRTGARFAPVSSRGEVPADLLVQPPRSRPVGARFGPYSALPGADDDTGEIPGLPVRAAPPEPEPLPSESDVLIRPYARTGGRTQPTHDLAIEALVSARPQAADRYRSREHRAVVHLCARPRSVAEVAALLKIPLGVARVLLGDLATDGSVVVHRALRHPPDLALMGRVLAGLRRL